MTLGMDVWVGYLTLCGIACPWMQAQRILAGDPVDCNTAWHCLLTTESRNNQCPSDTSVSPGTGLSVTSARDYPGLHTGTCRMLYVGLCDMFPMIYTVNVTI